METNKKINFWKVSSTILLISLALVLVFQISYAWTNPTANPSSGAGAISVSGVNIGIANSSPDAMLTLGANNGSQGYLRLRGGTGIYEGNIYHDTTYAIRMDTSGNSHPIRIDGSAIHLIPTGNVGIGTASPATKFHLYNTAPNSPVLRISDNNPYQMDIAVNYVRGSQSWYLDASRAGAASIIVRTSKTAALDGARVDFTGDGMGIGTAAGVTPDANYKITTTAGGIKAENSSASQPAGYFSNAGGGPALMIGTGGFVTETRTSDPSSPVAGQIWLRTDL